MSFAVTDDKKEIYYEVHGTAVQTLVFVSGYFGVANIWLPLISQLGSKYRSITYDSRGYGRSAKPMEREAYSVERHAADLHAVLTACQATSDRSVLVTHSMGGNIGAAYCLKHPSHISGIVFSGTYFDGKLMAKCLTYDMLTSGVEDPSKCVAFYTNMGLDHSTALEAAKWPAYARRNNAAALFAFDMGDRYASIKVPGLILQGEKDLATPVDILCKPMAEQMPNCRLEVLKSVMHFPPCEAPEEFQKLLEVFIHDL